MAFLILPLIASLRDFDLIGLKDSDIQTGDDVRSHANARQKKPVGQFILKSPNIHDKYWLIGLTSMA